MSGRRRLSRPALLCGLLGALFAGGPVFAQAVRTPAIPVEVRPGDREVRVEWDHPADSLISSLSLVDTSWGGTAKLKVYGTFTGDCDLDLRFRTTNSTDLFMDPFVDTVLFQNVNPNRPNYFTGSSVPYAGGKPDICSDHSILLVALGTDSLTSEGNASGSPLLLEWIDVPNNDTIALPADFRAGVDTLPLTVGVWAGFQPGTVNAGDELSIVARSRDIQLAWDYILTGALETERVSSSDPGETEVTICRPGEVKEFRFGLSVTIDVDTTDEGDVVGSVRTGGDSLGIASVLWRKIDGYRVYRSDITNPERFVLLRELSFCDDSTAALLSGSEIAYVDSDGVHNGFPYVYYVTAYDTLTHAEGPDSMKSGRTVPRTEAREDMGRISVVPNPYKRNAAWEEGSEKLQFTNLPERATLRVFTVGGDLVREWEHDGGIYGGNSDWDLKNADGDPVVSGVYIYYVKSAAGGERVGKFVIVR
ncbi:MAG: hypothetical protein EHM19_09055 [Candidatus Latescibacterota bacterium]|nr:MAG: hypothetical protein EHM19_09055 [Candidatus Latescibacterota bacterium]